MPSSSFTDLRTWQKAHQFVLAAYRLTEGFPRTETYGLTSQLRRAAVSIPANLAEGFRKNGIADKIRMMNISQGSAEEARYYLILANDLGYAETADLQHQLDEVCRLLDAYIQGIRRNTSEK